MEYKRTNASHGRNAHLHPVSERGGGEGGRRGRIGIYAHHTQVTQEQCGYGRTGAPHSQSLNAESCAQVGAPASSAYMNLDVNGLQNALTLGARLAGQALPYPPVEAPSVLGSMPVTQDTKDASAPASAAVPSPAAALEPDDAVPQVASAPAPSSLPSVSAPKVALTPRVAPASQPALHGAPSPAKAAQSPSSKVSDVGLPAASAPAPLGLAPQISAPLKGNKYSNAQGKAGLKALAPAPRVPGTLGDPTEASLSNEAPAPAIEEPHDEAQDTAVDDAVAAPKDVKPSTKHALSSDPTDSKFDLPPTIASLTHGKGPGPVPAPTTPTPASPSPASSRNAKRASQDPSTANPPTTTATTGRKTSRASAHAPAPVLAKGGDKAPLKGLTHAPAAKEKASLAVPAAVPEEDVVPLDTAPAVAPAAPKKSVDELLLETQASSLQFTFTPEEIAASGWVPSPLSSTSVSAPAPSAKLPRRAGKGAEAPAPKKSRSVSSPVIEPPTLEAPLAVAQG